MNCLVRGCRPVVWKPATSEQHLLIFTDQIMHKRLKTKRKVSITRYPVLNTTRGMSESTRASHGVLAEP